MSDLFSSHYYTRNRQKLRQLTTTPLIVVTSHGLLQRASDNTFPFQQDSNFWYLTGINQPDLTLVIDGDSEYLIVPGRSASREAFDGAVDRDELTSLSGIETVLDAVEGWERLTKSLTEHRQVATPQAAPAYIEAYGLYTNPARRILADKIAEIDQAIELIDCREALAAMRVIKQPEELAAIQRAIDITIASIKQLTEPLRLKTYRNEYEIEADLTREFRFRGASGHAFAPIVAGGLRACTLHNVANNAKLDANSLVVMDVGAEVSHYAADITRTKIYGTPTVRQQAVFDAVLDVQSYALSLLKPGVLMKTYEQQVETYMGTVLQDLGLINLDDDDDEAANKQAIRKFFPHSTSHFLGLDVHDVGDYSQPLQPGMVITCEPGIYIPAEGIGVRIEDDVLITDSGYVSLTVKLPKTLQ